MDKTLGDTPVSSLRGVELAKKGADLDPLMARSAA